MRNPNGYGSVYKLSGRRRKPYAARITLGFKEAANHRMHPIYKFIGYYKTRAEAMRALALYNGEEVEDDKKVTLLEVYEAWREEHEPEVKPVTFAQYKSGFAAFEPLHKKPIESLTIRDFEEIGEKSGKSKIILSKGKVALKSVYAYAFRKGIITESKANLPTFIKFANAAEGRKNTKHTPFTHEEVDKLWEHTDDDVVQVILFMIYTGVRISEIADLKSEDVHLDKRYFEVKASKTEAGVRKVPIHDKLLPIANEWKRQNNVYFAPILSKQKYQSHYRARHFIPCCERILGVKHLPHDPRYTTIAFLTEVRADLRHIKLICGHAQGDVTNDVYAKKISIEALLETINMIP